MASILSRSLQLRLIWSWRIHRIKPWECPVDKWNWGKGHISGVVWFTTDILLSSLTLISDQIWEPPGSFSTYRLVVRRKPRAKMKTAAESVLRFQNRWTANDLKTPDWSNWMNLTAVSTLSTSTLQSCRLRHRERSILCATGTTLQMNL